MHFLLITDSYPPEIRSISLMIKELAETLIQKGHTVTVATCWPQYNLSCEIRKDMFQPVSKEEGVTVFRIKTPPHHKVNFIIRGIAQLLLPYIFLDFINKHLKEKVDVVMVYSPPLPLFRIGNRFKKMEASKFIFNVQDIFPQIAIDLGAMKNRLLIKFFERMENLAYEQADVITTHTHGNRLFLIEKKSVPSKKITTIYNWIDLKSVKEVKATGQFRKKYKLQDKFIFLFPGVMGPAQNLGFIIEVAHRVQDIPDICFLFMGDGTERKALEKQAADLNLTNVCFKPFISQEQYPYLLKEVNVGLVCLGPQNKISSMPGKIAGFMAASLPILAFLNEGNEGHAVIKEADCGYTQVSDDPEFVAKVVRDIFNQRDRFCKLGENGYNYSVLHFCKEKTIEEILRLI
jgi:glycosyltransferase involved in cell wall biosynthesis